MKTKQVEEELLGTQLIENGRQKRTVGYLRGGKIEYKMLLGSDGPIEKFCRVLGMPLYYLVGSDGEVLWSKGTFPPVPSVRPAQHMR